MLRGVHPPGRGTCQAADVMKTIPSIHRPALLGLLTLSLGTAGIASAQEPTVKPPAPAPATKIIPPVSPTPPPAADAESADPFSKRPTNIGPRAAQEPSAEMMDAQARVLFARNETEIAIELQMQAVEKAKQTLAKCTENLARYQGKPVDDGPIGQKIRAIIIPAINFQDTSLDEAVEFLRMKCVELDGTEKDPAKKGVNFVIGSLNMNRDPFATGAPDPNAESPRIKGLVLRNVSVADVLKHLGRVTGTRYTVEDGAVTISAP